MVMERDVVIIESDTSYDYFPGQTTSDESFDHNPFQATFDESYDHNPFQVTSDDTSDDTLKSSSEDTCKQGSRSAKAKKATIPTEIAQWYDDFSSDEVRTVYKVTNSVLGLAAVITWQQILNKEFGMRSSKENVGRSSNVRMKGKRKMLWELQFRFVKLVHVFVKVVSSSSSSAASLSSWLSLLD
ncbi:hypothetical protein Tco_0866068 [Tanacetum coccineum]